MSHGVTPNVILRFGEFQLSQDIGSTCVHSSRQGSNHDLVCLQKGMLRLHYTISVILGYIIIVINEEIDYKLFMNGRMLKFYK